LNREGGKENTDWPEGGSESGGESHTTKTHELNHIMIGGKKWNTKKDHNKRIKRLKARGRRALHTAKKKKG